MGDTHTWSRYPDWFNGTVPSASDIESFGYDQLGHLVLHRHRGAASSSLTRGGASFDTAHAGR